MGLVASDFQFLGTVFLCGSADRPKSVMSCSHFVVKPMSRVRVSVALRRCAIPDSRFSGCQQMRFRGLTDPCVSGGAGPRCRAGASSRPWRLAPFGLPSLTPLHLRCCVQPLAMRVHAGGRAGLLFPSSSHAGLAVKVCACLARWRPGGRLRTLTAALRRAASGLGQFRPASFQGERP